MTSTFKITDDLLRQFFRGSIYSQDLRAVRTEVELEPYHDVT